jgi:hypothetical protein
MTAHDLPIEAQVANVLAGKTTSGREDHARPFPFPESAEKRELLLRWSSRLSKAPDDVRTAFIRKIARHIALHTDAGENTDLAVGIAWLIANPEQIRTPLTFEGALRRAREGSAFNAAYEAKLSRNAMAKPVPAQPVLFDDGTHRLVELVHPAHLIETGLLAWNCLVRRIGGQLACNGSYWCRIAEKTLRLFALRRGPQVLCVLSMEDGALQEWQYVSTPADVNPLVPAIGAALVRDAGPLRTRNAVIVHGGMFLPPHTKSVRVIRRALEGGDDA